MDDYLTRVAEAVRDVCAETCHKQHAIAERRPIPATICAMHIGHIDLPAIIASVPRPDPVAAQWRPMDTAPKDGRIVRLLVEFSEHATEDAPGPSPTIGANNFANDEIDLWLFAGWCWSHDHFTQGSGTVLGWMPMVDDQVSAQPTVPADDAATLRSAIRAMASMLQAREWAEHVSTDPVVTDLEAQVTELVGTATTLREQNTALVEALERLAPSLNPNHPNTEFVFAALASAKGGA